MVKYPVATHHTKAYTGTSDFPSDLSSDDYADNFQSTDHNKIQ